MESDKLEKNILWHELKKLSPQPKLLRACGKPVKAVKIEKKILKIQYKLEKLRGQYSENSHDRNEC